MSPSSAQGEAPDPNIQKVVEKGVQDFRVRTGAPGVAVALYLNGADYYFNFGHADLAPKAAVTEDTLFELGSVTKLFTATMLAYQVAQGERRLDDQVTRWLPVTPEPSWTALKQVTLLDLATHTSGIGSDARGIGGTLFGGDPPSLELVDFWTRFNPSERIGTEWQYSDTGFVTLGYAVVGPDGPCYYENLWKIIAEPLGLRRTAPFAAAPGGPVAQGYRGDKDGVHRTYRVSPDLKSTSRDVLTFLKANLGLIEVPLPLALAFSSTIEIHYRTSSKQSFNMGLGWQIKKEPPHFCAKNGGTGKGGFGCAVWIVPEAKAAMVFLTNLFGDDAEGAGGKILSQLLGLPPEA